MIYFLFLSFIAVSMGIGFDHCEHRSAKSLKRRALIILARVTTTVTIIKIATNIAAAPATTAATTIATTK